MNKTTGTLITVGNVSVRIYEAPDNGTAAHTETFTNVITNGTFSVQVGNSTTLNLTYNRIYWLEIDVNGEEVVGNATGASGRRAFISTAGPDATILIANDTSRNVGVNITNPGGIFQVSAGGTSTALFVNGTTGYVGIGTAGPNTNLNVVGSVNISGTINGTWNGNTIATNYLNVNGIQQANLTGLTIPAANVSAGTFASGLFTFQNNLTVAQNLTVGNALWVDSALRKVGINTTSPSGILQVNVNGSDVFHINETGNVGIGTAAPLQTLTVAGTANVTGALIAHNTKCSAGQVLGTTTNGTLQCVTDQTGGAGVTLPAANVTAGTFPAGNFIFTGGSGNIFNVNSSFYVNGTTGYVGIGTTGPETLLDIRKSTAGGATSLHIRNTDTTLSTSSNYTDDVAELTFGPSGNWATYARVVGLRLGDFSGASTRHTGLAFVTANAGTEAERMRIDNSGNVGIGTTSPLEKLHLAGNIFINNTGVATSTAAFNSSDIILQSSAWNGSVATAYNATLRHIATNGTGNLTRLGITVNGSERVSIDSIGNVGIGTTGPLQTLTVAGTANVTSTLTITSTDYKTQTLTDGATISWDASAGDIATVTLGGNRAMAAPTNLKKTTYILHVIQDGTGSRTLTWNSVFKWPSGVAPTLTTTASARDVFSFISDGTNLYGSYILDVK